MKLTTVTPLHIQSDQAGIYVTSPRVPGRLKVKREVAETLLLLHEPHERSAIRHPALTTEQMQSVITTLAARGYLTADTDEATTAKPHPWDLWGSNAWNFHEQLKDAPFLGGPSHEMTAYVERITARDMPPSFRETDTDTPILLLPRIRSALDMSLRTVLESRRTHRHFDEEAVLLDDFATLLHYAFAPLRFADSGVMGVQQLKAYASGGARHETEAYIAVFNVQGVEPGAYRYDTIRHGLVPIDADLSRTAMEHFTYQQGFFTTSSFGVITTALTERMAWKYPHPRAYKLMLHNVGHLVQVFTMTATALGYGAAITGAFRDTDLEHALSVTGTSEFPTFFMSCGKPQLTPEGLPVVFSPPHKPTRY